MDSEKTGVWLRDGNLVYELMENPNPTRRMSSPVNRWWAQINTQRDGATMDEVVAIASRIRRLPELEAENAALREALSHLLWRLSDDNRALRPFIGEEAHERLMVHLEPAIKDGYAALGTETK